MASQVSIDTTAHQLKSLAQLTGGSGSSRVGGAYYWTGANNAAIRQYGAWEIDFFNQGQAGYAPVLLMWPIPDVGNWPIDGEIDIVELGVTTSATTTFTGGSINLHLDTSAGSSRALHLSFPSKTDWTAPHTVRMEWMPSYISIFLDGTQVATTTDTSYIPHTKPMRLTMQQEFYGVSDSSISSLSAYTTVTGLRAYSSTSSIA
jgi:beta-glucanase (GH16 family)